jgi:protocatechuate 3,4-dioxygenase beta subunit
VILAGSGVSMLRFYVSRLEPTSNATFTSRSGYWPGLREFHPPHWIVTSHRAAHCLCLESHDREMKGTPEMTDMTRRKAMTILAITAAGGAILPRSALAQTDRLITGADVCVITPETTEGPFYFDPALVRADITEGRPGLPVRLRLQVVDEACFPIRDARVDVWHCDAEGAYSGYDNKDPRETFMRGTQLTGLDGVAEFATIYPGWYPGRTPHIHFKVFLDETTLLTGQLFFPDDVSDQVYASAAPYKARTGGRTVNSTDGIAARAGTASVAEVSAIANGYDVAMIISVDPGTDGAMSFPLTNG